MTDLSGSSADHQQRPLPTEQSAKGNSFTQWGFPIDLAAGPGSYSPHDDLGLPSFKYTNSPKAVIPTALKSPKLVISKELEKGKVGGESPGVGRYSPNVSLSIPTLPKIGIGKGKARNLEEMENMKIRSPGPIYAYTEQAFGRLRHNASVCFPKGKKGITVSPSPLPSPVSYSPSTKGSRLNSPTFKHKDDVSKLYFPNYFRYLKGKEGPGPAAYEIQPELLGRQIAFAGRGGEKKAKEPLPGPGTYYEKESRVKQGRMGRFGKSSRSLDPRACNPHTDSISHVLAKY